MLEKLYNLKLITVNVRIFVLITVNVRLFWLNYHKSQNIWILITVNVRILQLYYRKCLNIPVRITVNIRISQTELPYMSEYFDWIKCPNSTIWIIDNA